MNTFIQNFISNTKARVFTSTKGLITNSFQKINEALTRYKQQLLESNPRYDSLICALTQDPKFISDEMVTNGIKHINNCSSPAEIEEDDARLLYEGVMDAITNNGTENERGLTITDAKGYSYNFINQATDFNHPYQLGDNKILLSSSNVPSSVSEAILYIDDQGRYQLNNVVRTANFVKKNAELVKGQTVLAKIITCCFVALKPIPNTIFSGLISLIDDVYDSGDITDAIDTWYEQHPDIQDVGETIFDRIDVMEDYYIEHWTVGGQGAFSSIWSIFSDIIESSTLNSAILATIQAVQGFNNFSIEFFQTLAEKVGSKYNSVKTFFSGARDAFLKGGFTGLGTYILSYVRAIASLTDDDGLISFSDNKDLVPQQYIAGLVFQILSAVVTVIGIIVSIFSKIIGVAITVIGGILGAIAQAVSADASQQYAALQLTDSTILPIAPYALFQMSVDTSAINSQIMSLFENGAELVAQEVPGGYVLIGPSKMDPDYADDDTAAYYNRYPECIYKFYPSIIPHNSNDILYQFVQDVDHYQKLFSCDSWRSDIGFNVTYNKEAVRSYLISINEQPDYISKLYVSAAEDADYMNDDDGLLKDSSDIDKLTQAIVENITWFILWVGSSRGALSDWEETCYAYPYNNARADFYAQEGVGFTYCYTIPYCYDETHFYPMADGVHFLGTFHSGTFWEELGYYATQAAYYPVVREYHNYKPFELRSLINSGYGVDIALDIPARMTFAIKTPKYSPDTFWFWVIFSAIVMVAVTVVAVVATLKVKKAINRKRAQNQASVEAAWDKVKNKPSNENYDNYRKTVKKNNRWATLIGGTKYDYVNYWNGDVSASNDGSDSGDILSGLDLGQDSLEPMTESSTVLTDDELLQLKLLICGVR